MIFYIEAHNRLLHLNPSGRASAQVVTVRRVRELSRFLMHDGSS